MSDNVAASWQVAHGNEDTFREMLRIRRSVAASFSQTHFNTAGITVADSAGPSTGALPSAPNVTDIFVCSTVAKQLGAICWTRR